MKELAKAFVIPISEKITPEYKVHLLGVLNLLKEILDDMNIASNTLLDKIFKRLNEAHGTIELQEDLYKPVQDFFEHTESDEKLVGYLKQAALSGSVNVVSDEREDEQGNSSATMEVVNRAGYILFNADRKRLYQLSVAPRHRRKGVATKLLSQMQQVLPQEKIQCNNVDEAATGLKIFLEKQGLVNEINQFEVGKDL